MSGGERDGREKPLFFAQREAAETIIFLAEARPDFLQGIEVPRDDAQRRKKDRGLLRFHPVCLQDGDWLGQDHRHGHAGSLEHSQ